jgi:catechol 2,3-dioxygenase-like lactoylglutathione lyase family enzyme
MSDLKSLQMFSHVTVGCSDLRLAQAFYDAVLTPLGFIQREVIPDGGPTAMCWILPDQPSSRFYVYMPFNGEPAMSGNGCMVAFNALSVEAVNKAYAGGIAANGKDDGKPGYRMRYAPDYYGAYLRDPDGNKIHIVHRSHDL